MLRRRGVDRGEERERGKELDALLAESAGPLDRDEQEKVVFAFQQQQYDLLKQWRTSFGVLSFGLSAFFAYHALNQAIAPWQLKCTAQFSGVLSSGMVALGYGLSAAPLAAMGMHILRGHKRDRELVDEIHEEEVAFKDACGVLTSPAIRRIVTWASVGMAAFWAAADWASDGLFQWHCSWVSWSPLIFCLAEIYIEGMARSSMEDVKRLRKLMYDFRKI